MKKISFIILCAFLFSGVSAESLTQSKKDLMLKYQALMKSADDGSIESQYQIFSFVIDNISILNDKSEAAFAYLKSAAQQGHVNAQFKVGAMYQTGQAIKQDFDEALKWLTLAANNGHLGATIMIANNFALRYVKSENKIDKEKYKLEATLYYERAYSIDGIQGAWYLGNFLFLLDNNSIRAESLLNQAAIDGSARAMKSLGRMYSYKWSETRDILEYEKALNWFAKANKNGLDTNSYIKELNEKKQFYDESIAEIE